MVCLDYVILGACLSDDLFSAGENKNNQQTFMRHE
jgi:hypothetical protein